MSTKKRTEADRRLDRHERLRARVNDIYRRARKSHLTHAAILDALTAEVYDHPDYQRIGTYYTGQLAAQARTWQDRMWAEDLIWRLGPAAGPFTEAENADRWAEGQGASALCRIPGALYGGHFWAGTDCPFTEYKATN